MVLLPSFLQVYIPGARFMPLPPELMYRQVKDFYADLAAGLVDRQMDKIIELSGLQQGMDPSPTMR